MMLAGNLNLIDVHKSINISFKKSDEDMIESSKYWCENGLVEPNRPICHHPNEIIHVDFKCGLYNEGDTHLQYNDFQLPVTTVLRNMKEKVKEIISEYPNHKCYLDVTVPASSEEVFQTWLADPNVKEYLDLSGADLAHDEL